MYNYNMHVKQSDFSPTIDILFVTNQEITTACCQTMQQPILDRRSIIISIFKRYSHSIKFCIFHGD